MSNPLVTFNEVSFAYQSGPPVLNNISFSVAAGSVTGIVGPSGCGKTTLLSLMAGLLSPSSGKVTWEGEGTEADTRHPLTMLFQKDTLLPWQNLESNVGLHFKLGGAPKGVSRAERRERVAELIELAGLKGSEKLYPYQLSGGMRRRAAFLAAVAPRPKVMLLDEPFSALDEPTRVVLHQDIYRIIKTYGIAVMLVTHDLAEAISLSDEVLILSSGPARIVDVQRINFGSSRNMLELRQDPAFLRIYGKLWEALQKQITGAESPAKAVHSHTNEPDQPQRNALR